MYSKRNVDYDDEPCCKNPELVVNDDGTRVCRNCGLTFGQAFVDTERRAYTSEEVQSRRRTEPKWRSFGPRTVITNVSTDSRGHHLEARKQALFSRLSKIQGSLVSSLERNFWEAKPKLNSLALKTQYSPANHRNCLENLHRSSPTEAHHGALN